jgi:nicotinamidase/pyrazinamidase
MQDCSRRSFLAAAGSLSLASIARSAHAQAKIKPGAEAALVVVDVQNCFLPGGSLAVAKGEEVIPVINRIAKSFQNVVLTQDWHTPGHISFASSHPGKKPFESIELPYGKQILWPDHCVQGTGGAEFRSDLALANLQLVIRKGFRPHIDSYSAFYENDRKTPTGLAGYLRERGLKRLFVAGLALDFCVRYSAEDARREGFEVVVVEDACRGIDVGGSVKATRESFAALGVGTTRADLVG